jgi:DNA-binding NarL/FixJ family response regulator
MREGKRDKEIAVILGISSRTVEKHVHQVLEKMQVENRCSAISILSGNSPSWRILKA